MYKYRTFAVIVPFRRKHSVSLHKQINVLRTNIPTSEIKKLGQMLGN